MSPRDQDDAAPAGRDWLSVPQIADDELHCGRRSIYRAILAGELKAAVINGRGDLRVHRDWLRDWLEKCAEKAPRLRRVG